MAKGHPVVSFLLRAHLFVIGIGLLYGAIVLLVMTPFIQTHVVYAHRIDFFGYDGFEYPENYGLAPGKTVNLKLRSSDNITIGAWFIFADAFYHEHVPFPPPTSPTDKQAEIRSATTHKPTILFLHGNTGTRALSLRIAVYTALTSRLDANVLAIDYRGFGDSEGHPTVEGVSRDARAGWEYLLSQGAKPEDILIVGHSLGTAIAGLLSAELGREGVEPRGLVLMSPFSSVRLLMDQYYLFGFLPLLKPLAMIPFAPRVLTWSVVHKFDTLTLVPNIKCSVLIAHAEDDWDIQHAHSSVIFNAFLDRYLSPLPDSPHITPLHLLTHAHDWDTITARQAARADQRAALVTRTDVHNFGTLHEFDNGKRRIALLKTMRGNHDIGRVEGVQDVIGRMFGLL
ncbi:Monoacylglycerol lipase ABHD12 [Hypsizygus marmoreus]|uniref:Monoacylglycerol lipase ABHD12 n=1 Tax=Hypsizygus marmoreus TaxID=39966 RepID=A0A369J4X5_HYPMA|nr:Monoacylglycerol lipase ABHD12 [Hypsizygus marmoreus]